MGKDFKRSWLIVFLQYNCFAPASSEILLLLQQGMRPQTDERKCDFSYFHIVLIQIL